MSINNALITISKSNMAYITPFWPIIVDWPILRYSNYWIFLSECEFAEYLKDFEKHISQDDHKSGIWTFFYPTELIGVSHSYDSQKHINEVPKVDLNMTYRYFNN